LTILIFNSYCFGQPISFQEKDRYVVIENLQTFFIETDGFIEIPSFDLYNIYEAESSKPVFESVNEILNVEKFYIKSHSANYENRRTCYLKMNKTNYINTFKFVLHNMNVKHIIYQGQNISTEDFFIKYL
jgi:hypothetical protein